MLLGVVEIGDCGVDEAGAASAKISCDCSEFFCIARNEEEARTLRGPDAAGRFGDPGSSAEDEDLARSLNWSFLKWSVDGLLGSAHRLVGPVF